MNKLTDKEMQRAFGIWFSKYSGSKDEEWLEPFLSNQIYPFVSNQKSSLKVARNGLFLSARVVAKRLGIARSAYSKYEECEIKGSITLATLAKAAEAIDCELVYAIRPKNKKHYSQIIWEKLLSSSVVHPWLKKCDQKRRGEALAYVANRFMNDPDFRKKQGWSQRANR